MTRALSQTPGAIRKRRCRARQKAGRRVYEIEADETALADKLVTARYLSPLRADDPEAQREALQRVIDDLEIRPG